MNLLKNITSFMMIILILCIGQIDAKASETDLQDEYEIIPLDIFVNGKKVNYSVEPIVKDERTLVLVRETFEMMGATVDWVQEEKAVYATRGSTKIKLLFDSTIANINEYEVHLDTPPVIYKNKTMMPLRFVGEAFGGMVHYDSETKAIHIVMPKFMSEFLVKGQERVSDAQPVENVKFDGNRRLMISDNPETFNSNTIKRLNATLWNDVVKSNRTSQDHRVFGWHINELNENITIGITIENLSTTNTIEIRNLNGIHKVSPNSWYEYDIGIPISETVLNDSLIPIDLSSHQVQPSKSLLLGQFQLNAKDAIGFLHDFTVIKSTGTGDMNYVIRTVISRNNDDLTKIKGVPVTIDPENLHPRGAWSSSELVATLPNYKVEKGNNISFSISNGKTDNLMNESNSLVDNGIVINNRGHYGAVYKVQIPYVNENNKEKTVRIKIGSTGGSYSGSFKTIEGVYNVYDLKPFKEIVKLLDYKVTDKTGIIEIEIMHAGGSTLPLVINIHTLED